MKIIGLYQVTTFAMNIDFKNMAGKIIMYNAVKMGYNIVFDYIEVNHSLAFL